MICRLVHDAMDDKPMLHAGLNVLRREERQGAEDAPYRHHAERESDVPHPVDNEGLVPCLGIVDRRVPEANKQVRAGSHPFPPNEHEEEVFAQNQ